MVNGESRRTDNDYRWKSMLRKEEIKTIFFIVCLKHVFTSIDHNYKNSQYATSGETVSLWDEQRAQPLQSFKWGADSHAKVKFNPIEV